MAFNSSRVYSARGEVKSASVGPISTIGREYFVHDLPSFSDLYSRLLESV